MCAFFCCLEAFEVQIFQGFIFYTLSKTLITCRDMQPRFLKVRTLLNNSFKIIIANIKIKTSLPREGGHPPPTPTPVVYHNTSTNGFPYSYQIATCYNVQISCYVMYDLQHTRIHTTITMYEWLSCHHLVIKTVDQNTTFGDEDGIFFLRCCSFVMCSVMRRFATNMALDLWCSNTSGDGRNVYGSSLAAGTCAVVDSSVILSFTAKHIVWRMNLLECPVLWFFPSVPTWMLSMQKHNSSSRFW